MPTLPAATLLLLLAAAAPRAAATANGTVVGSGAGGCADDKAFLAMCDGWSIGFVVLISVLGVLIVARLWLNTSRCLSCEFGRPSPPPPPVPEEAVRV